jgi:hypothetical protein
MEYGICDVVGSGTSENPYRPLIADYGSSYVAIIPEDRRCAFVKAQGGDLVAASADPGIFHITLGLQETLTAGQATTVNNKFDRWNLTTRASAGRTVKQVLVDVIQELDVTADFKNYKLNNEE